MNRSRVEIEKIKKMLTDGERPELYDLLLLDAQNSSNNQDNALAIVQSFQGLEIFLQTFLIKELQTRKKYTEQRALDYISMGSNWKTKTRLKEVLKETTGFTLADKNQTLWDRWCTLYDGIRNKVIHKGKEATDTEVLDTLKSNLEVVEILKTL
jgi:hypothetical protein